MDITPEKVLKSTTLQKLCFNKPLRRCVQGPPKCRNCGGPHRSDSLRCLAQPTRAGAPTKEQLRTFRQAGEREFHAVARAKAAEGKAAAVEVNIELTSSQPDVLPNSTSQASSVDTPAGDAMRL